MKTRECSFRGVRIGEVFVPLVEHRKLHRYNIVKERGKDGKVRFVCELLPGRVPYVHHTLSKWGGSGTGVMDNRQYVKVSENLSMTVGSGADAIFSLTDTVLVLGTVDELLKDEVAA
jgi:hypothetical protein